MQLGKKNMKIVKDFDEKKFSWSDNMNESRLENNNNVEKNVR